MTSFLEKIFKWAKCKHEKLRVIGFLPNQYIVKCAQCGELRTTAKKGQVKTGPLPVLDMEEKDWDPQRL